MEAEKHKEGDVQLHKNSQNSLKIWGLMVDKRTRVKACGQAPMVEKETNKQTNEQTYFYFKASRKE